MNAKQEELRRRLLALGFDAVRFARTDAPVNPHGLHAWLDQGMHADMDWMKRTAEKRLQPEQVLAGTRSVIVLGVNYWPGPDFENRLHGSAGPTWARYALHGDYHDTIKPALMQAGRLLEEIYQVGAQDYRYYVDTGPVLERNWAAEAGIGFVGKNAMLISREHGNWLFLAVIFVRLELEPDEPLSKARLAPRETPVGLLCGKCTRCGEACPTGAIVKPGVVDARLCVSYQTIENKGVIPRELRAGIGRRVYGCDVCLEVCPWNRFAQESRSVLLAARHDLADLSLRELLEMTPDRFSLVFRKTAIKRVKLAGLLRNACVVAGNTGAVEVLDILIRLAGAEPELVKPHAIWAVFTIAGHTRAAELLAAARATESSPLAIQEYAWWDEYAKNPARAAT